MQLMRARARAKRRKVVTERMRQNYVRIKTEKGCLTDGCGDAIDLADSSDENEPSRGIDGRSDVRYMDTDDGTCVEMIEFLSEAESCADDKAEPSKAETLDLSSGCKTVAPAPRSARKGSTFHIDLPPLAVDLTDTSESSDGLLCEYEHIYVDRAHSSSSEDYESIDPSDESDNGQDGSNSDTTVPRALATHRRAVKSTAPSIGKKVLQTKVFVDITNLEMCKPWRFVYRCLEMPFESNARNDMGGFLFERWDEFWRDHGRAVWERMYWKPMPVHCEEYKQRHNRQCRAAKAFCTLAEDLHYNLGVKLIDLVKLAPHSGWWYRSKRPVDLVRLRRQDARLYALHLARFRQRWPFGVRHVRLHCNSCWCLPELTSTID